MVAFVRSLLLETYYVAGMSTYRTECIGSASFHVLQTMTNGQAGRVVTGFATRAAADIWAQNQIEIDFCTHSLLTTNGVDQEPI
jgi:hypothetical protein